MKSVVLALCLTAATWGQCAMCFRNAEAQIRARAETFNKGILILAVPLAGAAGAIAWLAYSRRARII